MVLEYFDQIPYHQLYLSSITVAELEYGVRKSSYPDKNQSALQDFLTLFTILNFDREATRTYGIVRSELEKRGNIIGPLDMLIAAHAKSLGFTLVTNNEKEFRKVNGLKIENWTK